MASSAVHADSRPRTNSLFVAFLVVAGIALILGVVAIAFVIGMNAGIRRTTGLFVDARPLIETGQLHSSSTVLSAGATQGMWGLKGTSPGDVQRLRIAVDSSFPVTVIAARNVEFESLPLATVVALSYCRIANVTHGETECTLDRSAGPWTFYVLDNRNTSFGSQVEMGAAAVLGQTEPLKTHLAGNAVTLTVEGEVCVQNCEVQVRRKGDNPASK